MLAGVGSRFIAAVIDGLLQGVSLTAFTILAALLSSLADDLGGVGAAVSGIIAFLIFFGYHVAFETWSSGQSPGKRWTNLRVVGPNGAPVAFTASAIRNLMRLVDFLPWAYGVGVIAMLASSRNQRLGDMAAGTVVVRERRQASTSRVLQPQPLLTQPPPHWAYWDVSAISAQEMATVRRFLERRSTLTPDARYHLAQELAGRLRPKVTGPPDWIHPEDFLVEVANIKAARG